MLTSRDDWRKLKEKFGIPDAVCKFSMGEKVDAWQKKDKAGETAKDFKARVVALDALLKDMKTYEDALKAAKYDKFKGKTPQEQLQSLNQAKTEFHKEVVWATGLRDNYSRYANPLEELKTQLRAAKSTLAGIQKTDANALKMFYGQQIRNHVGLPVIQLLKMTPDPKMKSALDAYQAQSGEVNKLVNATGAFDSAKVWAACQLALAGLSFGVGA